MTTKRASISTVWIRPTRRLGLGCQVGAVDSAVDSRGVVGAVVQLARKASRAQKRQRRKGAARVGRGAVTVCRAREWSRAR